MLKQPHLQKIVFQKITIFLSEKITLFCKKQSQFLKCIKNNSSVALDNFLDFADLVTSSYLLGRKEVV